MIAQTFDVVFSSEWIKTHLTNSTHDLIILRPLIPWQPIIEGLLPNYNLKEGRTGHPLRTLVAVSILAQLRDLSDRQVIASIKENRYMQYFCDVPDQGLMTFMHASTLCRFRKRVGQDGIRLMEDHVFTRLKRAGVIDAEMMLMDTTVLESPIIYPTDVRLLYKAFDKMAIVATKGKMEVWWDRDHLKKQWRAYHLDRKNPGAHLGTFYDLFKPALQGLEARLDRLPDDLKGQSKKSGKKENPLKTQWCKLMETLKILGEQTQQKLNGQLHIANRLISLDDLDARPIKKGKSHPSTEFGTMLQFTFNRQGFMITTENFIGKPDDKTLYPTTLQLFRKRMGTYPGGAVTDQGFRSAKNRKLDQEKMDYIFMGKSSDVDETHQETARSARSATEGFIAVAKNLRGFGQSLYRGLEGATVWTLLNQCAYNLKKFLQLYRNEALSEETLMKLRL
jgi:IS5 family transposase